jgi:ABC-type uncharacterized transport system ATPase subunit
MEVVLRAEGITKRFPGVLANDHIDFDLRQGEIHALLGENGAGKSTLMNIFYGLYQPDEGNIYLNGNPTSINSAHDAIAQGIGMVHQHFMLVPPLTVTENIVLGMEAVQQATSFMGRLAVLDRRTTGDRIRELSQQYGLDVTPEAYVKDLTVGVQQRVEIVKALYREADILILDEPTAVLTPQEADELFIIMKSLAEQGKSIIFITHKLREVLAVADRISVLRAGRMVGTTTPAEATRELLAEMMVGRKVILSVDKGEAHPGQEVLQVENLRVLDDRHVVAVDGVGFSVPGGEILGIAGVQGNGQTELAEALTGLRPVIGGRVKVAGQVVIEKESPAEEARGGLPARFKAFASELVSEVAREEIIAPLIVALLVFFLGRILGVSDPALQALLVVGSFLVVGGGILLFKGRQPLPREIEELGVGHVPEDRHKHGLVLSYPVRDNLVLSTYYLAPFADGVVIEDGVVDEQAEKLVEEFDIRTPSIFTLAGSLSGGNQQKVIVARELSRPVKALIVSQPTRGLDVGSIEFIHNRIVQARDHGAAVLLISAELDEIMSLSDRIAVMYKGHILKIVPAEKATREGLGLLMAGVTEEDREEDAGDE